MYNRIQEKQQLLNSQLNLPLDFSILNNEINNQCFLPFLSTTDKLFRKCTLKCSIIDVEKEKDNYFLCHNNSLVTNIQ